MDKANGQMAQYLFDTLKGSTYVFNQAESLFGPFIRDRHL